mmetsp:Transcript_67522/g.60652  ORF Transcript_67522/g.60652 Transcript_67522/m.60652 type:complete len:327 (-) Transcript_67522:346-1326(-)
MPQKNKNNNGRGRKNRNNFRKAKFIFISEDRRRRRNRRRNHNRSSSPPRHQPQANPMPNPYQPQLLIDTTWGPTSPSTILNAFGLLSRVNPELAQNLVAQSIQRQVQLQHQQMISSINPYSSMVQRAKIPQLCSVDRRLESQRLMMMAQQKSDAERLEDQRRRGREMTRPDIAEDRDRSRSRSRGRSRDAKTVREDSPSKYSSNVGDVPTDTSQSKQDAQNPSTVHDNGNNSNVSQNSDNDNDASSNRGDDHLDPTQSQTESSHDSHDSQPKDNLSSIGPSSVTDVSDVPTTDTHSSPSSEHNNSNSDSDSTKKTDSDSTLLTEKR